MGRRLLASLAATAAVAASLLIGSAGAATAAPETSDSASVAASRGGGGVTPNAKLPKAIRVDETKFKVVATQRGIGKQVYSCGTDGKYALREPVATLSTLRGTPAGIHGKGPFWAHFDGSRVDGSAPVSAPSPAGPSNIAWLKVIGKSVPDAPGVFGDVAFIQRTDTRGGAAPADCTAPSTVAVDYSTIYVFWAAK